VSDSSADGLDVERFAEAYQALAEAVARIAPAETSPFEALLRQHLGQETSALPVVSMAVPTFDHANLQRAIDALLAEDTTTVDRLVGIRGQHRMFGQVTLAALTQGRLNLEIGPVDHVELAVDSDEALTCIDFGLLLIRIDGDPLAVLVRGPDERMPRGELHVEVMAPSRDRSAALLARLRDLMVEHNVFRAKVVSLSPGSGPFGQGLTVRFIERPGLAREDVILPAGVLERVERLTIDFSERAASLLAGGRHLRRGLLLHGAPGTGKTHTVRYLMSRLTDRSVFVLSGNGLAAIASTVALARQVQPSMVVLEDVDLVAEERTRPHAGTNPVLFELLNQMDGVEEDADLVFLLTTNRPDLLEPALAARPGRVDLAVEVPLPAAPERERLLQLYARGLRTDVSDWSRIVDQTEGVTAAFLRELLRQAALAGAAVDGAAPELTSDAVLDVLVELTQAHQAMTTRLLGGRPPT
jgi:hypothetical protein